MNDDHLTLKTLLMDDEHVLERIPYCGFIEIFIVISFGIIWIITLPGIYQLLVQSGDIFKLWSRGEGEYMLASVIIFLCFPFAVMKLLKTSLVVTERRIIKDSGVWASVAVDSLHDVKYVKADKDWLLFETRGGKVFKVKAAASTKLKALLKDLSTQA